MESATPARFLARVPPADRPPVLAAGVFMLITPVTGFFLTLFFRDTLHFGGVQIGLLVALQALCGLLSAIPAGLANDRLTSRTLFAAGLLGQSLGLSLMAVAGSFPAQLASVFLWSLSNALCRLSLDVQVLKSPSGSPMAGRLARYHGARFLGLTLGTLVAGAALTGLSFRLALAVTAGLSLLLVPVARGMIPTPVGRVHFAKYLGDLRRPRVLFFVAWLFLFCSHWGAEGTSYPLYLKDNLHLDLSGIGSYMAAEYLCVALAVWGSARLFERGRPLLPLLGTGLVLSGTGQAGLALSGMPVSVLFRMLHGLGDGVMLMFMYLGLFRLFPRERLGGHTGLITAVSMAGYIAGALLYGPLGERFGYPLPLWLSGGLILLLALALPALLGRPGPSAAPLLANPGEEPPPR